MKKWVSRKLLVAIASVVGIPLADLPESAWWVSIAYIVCQAVVDTAEVAMKHFKEELND